MSTVSTRPPITTVPVSALIPSPLNPRKSFDPTSLQALAESIAAQGVLQNLVVRDRGNIFEIAAGERRYRAVMSLVEAGRLEPTYELPVVVRKLTDRELLQIAMSENVKRSDMHPLEEADGYLKMIELGETADSVATAVGVAPSSVQKRLRIAEGLCDSGRQLLLSDDLTLAQAQALTLAPKATQEAYLSEYDDVLPHPRHIKQFFMDRQPPVSRAFFKPKDYTAQGGVIIQDLFAGDEDDDTRYFSDFDLFIKLQGEAVEAKKAEFEKKGFTVHARQEEYFRSWEYEDRKKHTVINVNPNTYAVEVMRDFGPIEKRPSAQGSAAAGSGEATPKPPQKNKKRMAFEDAALTKAAQNGVNASLRLAMVVSIAGSLSDPEGLRYGKQHEPMQVSHNPDYHDDEVSSTLAYFRAALNRVCEVKQEAEPQKEDMLAGPRAPEWHKGRATAILEHLNSLNDDALTELFQAVTAAHVTGITEGEPKEVHTWLLEQTTPDMRDFFSADGAYLQACRKSELEAVALELRGDAGTIAKKSELVDSLVHANKAELKEWLPERLRT